MKHLLYLALACSLAACTTTRDFTSLDELGKKQFVRKGILLNQQQWDALQRGLETSKFVETTRLDTLQGAFQFVEMPGLGGLIQFPAPDNLVNPEKWLVRKIATGFWVTPFHPCQVLAAKCGVKYNYGGGGSNMASIILPQCFAERCCNAPRRCHLSQFKTINGRQFAANCYCK